MNIYLAWTLTVLYWILYPIYWLVYAVLLALYYVLRPFYGVALFLLQPVIFFARLIATCFIWPFHFLARFETVYIYLGIAGLVGITFGLVLHFFADFLHSVLRLREGPKPAGPTVEQHRIAQRKKKARLAPESFVVSPLMSPSEHRGNDTPGRGMRGLLAQIIHEEDDSDF